MPKIIGQFSIRIDKMYRQIHQEVEYIEMMNKPQIKLNKICYIRL